MPKNLKINIETTVFATSGAVKDDGTISVRCNWGSEKALTLGLSRYEVLQIANFFRELFEEMPSGGS